MSIKILSKVSASPNPTPLPARLTLTTGLACEGQATETVDIAYSLDPAHNIWFLSGSAQAKTTERKEAVTRAGATVVHVLRLVEGPGEGPMDLVEVTQKIVDESARTRRSLVVVAFTRDGASGS